MLYPNRMLDTDKDFVETKFLDTTYREFVITSGDVLELYIYPNGGYNLIESQITIQSSGYQPQPLLASLDFHIDANGFANVPRIGQVQLAGMTESQAEKHLTALYDGLYEDAFVKLIVTGKYYTVFRGGTDAKQVAFSRPDLTLIEAIGAAGGIPETGRSAKIKVLRNTNGTSMIQQVDLSDVADLAVANTYILPNDIIYIEPGINSTVFQEIGPIISTVSSIVVIYAFFANLNQ